MALAQFCPEYDVLFDLRSHKEREKPLWETWKPDVYHVYRHAATAGLSSLTINPVSRRGGDISSSILFCLTYRMAQNVEISLAQAEQAEQHARFQKNQSCALAESEACSAFNHAPIGYRAAGRRLA